MRVLLAVRVDEQFTSLTQKVTISNSIHRTNKKNSKAHGAWRIASGEDYGLLTTDNRTKDRGI